MVHIIPLILFSFSSCLTPGPNNLMIMNSGLNFGIKNTIPHYLGVALGFPAMLLIVALGFGALFTEHLWLQQTFKVAGIAYMLFLAWKIARNNGASKANSKIKPLTFIQGVLFQWVNPKGWTMVISAISVFTISSIGAISNAVLITLIFLISCLISGLTWLLFGHSLQKFLKSEKHKKIFNYTMAAVLVLSIVLIFFE